MKIHRLNSAGSLAIVIPKQIADCLGWEEGQDVIVTPTEKDSVIQVLNMQIREQEKS